MTVTVSSQQEMFAQQTDKIFVVLLQLDHPTFSEPLYFVNDSEDLTSNGNVHSAVPFKITLPNDSSAEPTQAGISLDIVTQDIMALIRNAIGAEITVGIALVRTDDPDTIEVQLPTMFLRNIQSDDATLTGELALADLAREPFPSGTFTPGRFPGLF